MMPQKLSRRDALKVLGAAAGATALANLPAKWTTPELKAGVLPAHARSSCNCTDPALVVTVVSGTPSEFDIPSHSWVARSPGFSVQYGCDGNDEQCSPCVGCVISLWAVIGTAQLHVDIPMLGTSFGQPLAEAEGWAILLDVNACTYDAGDPISPGLSTPNCSFVG
jgi:hypothetical protein